MKSNNTVDITNRANFTLEEINPSCTMNFGKDERYNFEFKEAYMIESNDSDKGIKNCLFRIHSRTIEDLSFTEGATVTEYSDKGKLKLGPDGVKFLYFYNDIPTFDSYDRIWDGDEYIILYRDPEGVNLIYCRSGYRIPKIKIYVGFKKSNPDFSEYLNLLSSAQ